MAKRNRDLAQQGPAASPPGAARPPGWHPVAPSRSGTVVHRVVPAQGSLAAGSAAGGVIYDAKGPGGALMLAAVVAAAGSLALLGRAGAAISAAPAGSADPARERGREAPAPPHGATGGAGTSAHRTR